jgi:C-terminal processing protease CtpA/Prc
MWNELVRVIKYDKVSQEDKDHARLLLNQLNTASGAYFLKKDITYFLEDMVNKYGTIPTKVTLEKQLKDLIAEMEEFKAYWANKPKLRDDIIMVSNRMHEYSAQIIALKKQIGNY